MLSLLLVSGSAHAYEIQKLIDAAKAGDVESQSALGIDYMKGIHGVEKNYDEARKWLELATSKGNKEAFNALGIMYALGYGVDKNFKKAEELFKKAGDAAGGNSYHNLGVIYHKGLAGKKDQKLSLKYHKLAVEAGDPESASYLGQLYYVGAGVPKSYKKAIEYYKKGIELGSASALANLGIMYEYGEGVKKDYKKAAELYQAACDKEDKNGCDYIAELKESGKYQPSAARSKAKSSTQRLIAKSIDKGVNATFTWQGDDAVFTANDGKVDCTFLKDFSEKGGNLATSFVCTDNVQIILKQFRDTKNAYLAVMTDNFNTEVKSFSVNVYVTNTGSN